MSTFNVNRRSELVEYLVSTKQFGFESPDGTSLYQESPGRALQVNRLSGEEEFLDDARGIDEIHFEFSTNDLRELADGNIDFLDDQLRTKTEAVREGEISIGILDYSGSTIFDSEMADRLLELTSTHFHVITTPLMSRYLDITDINENPEMYERFIENTDEILNARERLQVDISVLGTLPVVPWSRVDEQLFDILLKKNVEGFCVDFLSKKPTAKSRVANWISPLMRRLGEEGRHQNSLLYAMNAYRGNNRPNDPRSPAEDFYAFGLGFDVLGGNYYQSRRGFGGSTQTEMRCFDIETFEQEYVEAPRLERELPDETGFNHGDILDNIHDDDERSRLQDLLEAEQMSLAYRQLREAIHMGQTAEFIRNKKGTSRSIQNRMGTVRESYEHGRTTSTISDF